MVLLFVILSACLISLGGAVVPPLQVTREFLFGDTCEDSVGPCESVNVMPDKSCKFSDKWFNASSIVPNITLMFFDVDPTSEGVDLSLYALYEYTSLAVSYYSPFDFTFRVLKEYPNMGWNWPVDLNATGTVPTLALPATENDNTPFMCPVSKNFYLRQAISNVDWQSDDQTIFFSYRFTKYTNGSRNSTLLIGPITSIFTYQIDVPFFQPYGFKCCYPRFKPTQFSFTHIYAVSNRRKLNFSCQFKLYHKTNTSVLNQTLYTNIVEDAKGQQHCPSPTKLHEIGSNITISLKVVVDSNHSTPVFYKSANETGPVSFILFDLPIINSVYPSVIIVNDNSRVQLIFYGSHMNSLNIISSMQGKNDTLSLCESFTIKTDNEILCNTHKIQFEGRKHLNMSLTVVGYGITLPFIVYRNIPFDVWLMKNLWYPVCAAVLIVMLLFFAVLCRTYMQSSPDDVMLDRNDSALESLLGSSSDSERTDLRSPINSTRGISPKVFISGGELTFKEQIGRGAFAIVYKGVWKHREVAIKQIQLPEEKKAEIIEEFYKEVRVMIELRHPNIVTLLAVCAKDPDFLLVTECLELGNLSHLLADKTLRLENEHMRKFALDCCAGMSYLHDLNLIHRDLKCRNLLVAKNWTVKVSDFGLSRFVEGHLNNHTLTSCGTPAFAAPEVLKQQKYSTKADVFSFAIVLWEIWVRKTPYYGISPYQVILQVIQNAQRLEIPAHVPVPIVQLMHLCWDELPENRPSFDECVEHLSKMKFEEPSTPYPNYPLKDFASDEGR